MSSRDQAGCEGRLTPLGERALISPTEAGALHAVFSVLANEHRLRLLHALQRAGELCVGELAEAVAMSPQAVSNQLGRLVDKGILAVRREGNFAYYRVVDPCVTGLMELGLCLVGEGAAASRPGAQPRIEVGQ